MRRELRILTTGVLISLPDSTLPEVFFYVEKFGGMRSNTFSCLLRAKRKQPGQPSIIFPKLSLKTKLLVS